MSCIEGPSLRLRVATADDAAARFSLGHSPDIVRMFGVSHADQKPMTMEAAAAWALGQSSDPNAWIIEVGGRLIGEIKLHSINTQDRRASMAIAIYDSLLLGNGFGSEAIRLLLHHAFTQLNLHRIGVRVLAYNGRAIRAYQKCGFVVEGRERETAFVDGVWHDDLMMGILSREFHQHCRGETSAQSREQTSSDCPPD
ncbi:MAG: GNAT family N-acetyltransferase [Rhizobium rhizophilum]